MSFSLNNSFVFPREHSDTQQLCRENEKCENLRLKLLQSELDLQKRKFEQVMSQLRTTDAEKRKAQSENESLKKEIEKLSGKLREKIKMENENASLKDRSKLLKDKVTFLESELKETSTDHRTELANLADQLGTVSAGTSKRKKETENGGEVPKMEAQLRQQEAELRSLQRKMEQCERENSSLREETQRMREEAEKMQHENITLRQNFDVCLKKAESFKFELDALKEAKDNFKLENEKEKNSTSDQLYELRADIEQKEKLIAYLQSVVQPKQMQKLPRHRSSLLSDGTDLSEIEMEYKQCLQLDKNILSKEQRKLKVLDEKQNEMTPKKKRHQFATYFRVTFYSRIHFGDENGSEWIYRERPFTSLAEACDRLRESFQLSLGHCRVQLLNTSDLFPSCLPPPRSSSSVSSLFSAEDPSVAYIGVAHVEPCKSAGAAMHSSVMANCVGKLGSREVSRSRCELTAMNENTFGLGEEDDGGATTDGADPTNNWLQNNVRTFVLNECQTDPTVAENAPELARMTLRRTTLTVENPFSGTRRRQRVVHKEQMVLSPLELACESILQKAVQIRHILSSAGLRRCRRHRLISCGYDKSALQRLDVKQLQLFLQGAVMPTVNAGLLAYAETFTAPAQQKRYGSKGLIRLWNALKTLLDELDEAMRVNEATMGNERREYKQMLRTAYENTVEKLNRAFALGRESSSTEKRRSMSIDRAKRSSKQDTLIRPIFAL